MDHLQPKIFIHILQNAPVCRLKVCAALSKFGLEYTLCILEQAHLYRIFWRCQEKMINCLKILKKIAQTTSAGLPASKLKGTTDC
jgi:hypothetical protein